MIKDGYHGDTNMMYIVGETSFLRIVYASGTRSHVSRYWPRRKTRFLPLVIFGNAIQQYVESERFGVVRIIINMVLVNVFHDEPQVLHYGQPKGTGHDFEEGMTFTIEPMVNAGVWQTKMLGDKWTVVTKDHSLSAQYEHTILKQNGSVDCTS